MINKKKLFIGLGLIGGFIVVLVIFFSPVFHGRNGLVYLDDLYNSISKGSAYYIPAAQKESEKFLGTMINVALELKDEKQAQNSAKLFGTAGAKAEVTGTQVSVQGDLGKILQGCLADADALYYNRGEELAGKYGYPEREVLYNWWTALKNMDKQLQKQKKFKEADVVTLVNQKAVEPAYNYYQVEPQKITARLGTVIFSLLFYVLYTVWYGFGILFLFEGLGLKLGH